MRITIAVAFVLTVGGPAIGAWSLVVRFRHARGIERQQLRWIAFAAALTGVAAAVVLAAMALGATAALLLAAGVPGDRAAGDWRGDPAVSALRHRPHHQPHARLRPADRAAGGGYAAIVLGLRQLLGRQSSPAVASATLAVAAAFRPTRRRVQQLVDRRFNRRRPDHPGVQYPAAPADRPGHLTAELLGMVEQTRQPTSVTLWLRPSTSASQDQTMTDASSVAR